MAKRKREIQLKFRVTPEEQALIHQKMEQYGTENMAAYLRKMAIDGYVVRLDLPELRELVSLLRRSSNNLNQLTRRVHETGRFYDADLEDLRQSNDQLWEAARRDGYPLLLDGTNASDDAGDRPGMQALRELEVRSPLQECGITKAEVRRLSREAGLFTWDKPAYACLATRVPTGTPIRREDLEKVERGEAALSALGFSDFRVRLLDGCARLQVTVEQLPLLLERREAVLAALEPLFPAVLLDLAARRASD